MSYKNIKQQIEYANKELFLLDKKIAELKLLSKKISNDMYNNYTEYISTTEQYILTDRDISMLKDKFVNFHTYQYIANKNGISYERTRECIAKSLEKIHHLILD
jgi:DNA-directed RNA polymerase sigma subunit (sigma70/sigma32)